MSQKYQCVDALPNQLQGAKKSTQKCQYLFAPASFWVKRLAQKCRHLSTQGKGQDIFAEMPCNKRPSQKLQGAS